jgi:Flp pilus assembly secretin CpaC
VKTHTSPGRTRSATLVGGAVVLTMLVGAVHAEGQPAATETEAIVVHLGQSRLIKSPWPVLRISITDPTIADVEAITPNRVLFLGRKVGTTDVVMWSEREETWQLRVDVQPDLGRLRKELSALLPRSELAVTQSQDVVVISGRLSTSKQAEQLEAFLEASEAATGLQYVNMTTVAPRPARVVTTRPAGPGQPTVPEGPYAPGEVPGEAEVLPAAEEFLHPQELEEELGRLLPGAALHVEYSRGVYVVTGTLRRAEQAERLRRYLNALAGRTEEGTTQYVSARTQDQQPFRFVDMTTVAGVQQVMLQVRVAEASRTAIRAMGINALWSGHHESNFFGFSQPGPDGGGGLNPMSIGPAGGVAAGPENTPFTFNADVNVSPLTTLVLGFPRAELEFFIQALAENQYLRILAEPTLVAMSGEEASFLAGGEFPIPVVQGVGQGGGTSISIEFKEFGVRLRFRPTVLGENTIQLHVAPEVSDLSSQGAVEIQGFQVPSIVTRRAETTLELRSGQTFSMAGLLNRTNLGRSSRIPGLGDVPVLGALFRSVRYENRETELVVLTTAWLVEPLSTADSPPVPGVLHSMPNDWELYLEGRIEGSAPPKLSDADARWLEELGLDELTGPGAWVRHDEERAESERRIERLPEAEADVQ